MAIIIRTSEDIIKDIFNDVHSRTPYTNLAPASKFRTIIDIFAKELEDVYDDVNQAIISTYITDASGVYLDAIGAMYGINRRRATSVVLPEASKTVKFYTMLPNFGSINNGNDIVIPPRTEIFGLNENGEKVVYRTTEQVTLLATEQEHYVTVESMGTGDKYNVPAYSLNRHNFTNYADAANNSLSVANTTPVTFASDDESDANYRYRILRHIQSIASANRTAIELAALIVPGVSDVKIVNHRFGTGSAAVVVKAITPTVPDSLVDMVQKSVSSKAALGTNIVAMKPSESPVTLSTTIYTETNTSAQKKEEIAKAARSAAAELINNLDIGEPLYVGDLARAILNSHPDISRIGKYNRFFNDLTVMRKTGMGYVPVTVTGDRYSTDEIEKLVITNDDTSIKLEVV